MTDSQKWLTLTLGILMGWLVYLLSPVLMPFVFAAMLAYLGDPLADKLEVIKIKSYQLGRTNAVIVVFIAIFAITTTILGVIIPKIELQISLFISKFPDYARWINSTIIPWVEAHLGWDVSLIEGEKVIALLKNHWQKAGGGFMSFMGSISRSGAVLAEWLMNLILIPVITFYLLRDWDILVEKIKNLLPRRISATAKKLALETDTVLGAFMRGQFYVMLVLGAIYSFGLWLVGLNVALLIGMIAGLVSFVPYLGSIVGFSVACIAGILQFQDVMYLIPISIVFVVGQSLEGMLLTPWLVGDKIGLHPVAVMFAVLAGGQLFGFLGVLLALPLASVVMVFLRHIHDIYRDSTFYTAEKK